MQSLSSQLIIQILAEEMGLPVNSIWLRDQNRTIPNDKGLYISVGIVAAQVTANVNEHQTINGVYTQISTVQQRESVQIDIFSSSDSVVTRHWEVVAALKSDFAQSLQEQNNFKIGVIPLNFLDTSGAEGGSILKRYTITIACLVWYRKTKAVDYYDDFVVRVDNEKTIGTPTPMIEFDDNSKTTPPVVEG